MGRTGNNKRRLKAKDAVVCTDLSIKEKYFDIFAITLLLGFGIYHSILYFGHQQVPHFDFRCFADTGHNILSFEIPDSFKRVPLTGILQVLLGKITGGAAPDMVGGWTLNALLHPLTAVLLWLVGRRIIGKAALWIAIIAIINPWVLQLQTEAIAEALLLFSVLLTFYFIFKQSNWSYLLASAATMVRYEGAALIFVAFVMDMINRKDKKQRILAFVYAVAASVPLAIWMLGTFLNWKGGTHYLAEMGDYSGGKIILMEYTRLVWQVGFWPLFMPPIGTGKETTEALFVISKVIVACSFIFAAAYGLYKRKWNIMALLIFFVVYIFVHATHGVQIYRYCMPVAWIPMVICFYGLQSLWLLVNKNDRIPKAVVVLLQSLILVFCCIWMVKLLPGFKHLAPISRRSASLPYVAMAMVLLIFLARIFIYKSKTLWRDIVISTLVCLVITSNHYAVSQVVGNGQRDAEFKYLVDWYIANAKKGEKLICTVPIILQTMAPEHEDSFLHTSSIDAENPNEFVKRCYEQNIKYVAWDSRMGLQPNNRYYGFWKMKNIAPLARPADNGPYKFITQIKVSQRRYINLFRLRTFDELIKERQTTPKPPQGSK